MPRVDTTIILARWKEVKPEKTPHFGGSSQSSKAVRKTSSCLYDQPTTLLARGAVEGDGNESRVTGHGS
jgi:hypothetical protein